MTAPYAAIRLTPAAAQTADADATPAAPEADAPDSTDKGLAFGHVPDLDDLTPHTRDVQRRGLVARDPSGQPQSAADWMNQAIKQLRGEDYEHAADGFEHAASIYTARGASEDAMVMRTYAARCTSKVGLFYERAPHVSVLRSTMSTGRRLEPVYGAYVGAFIDHEQNVEGEIHDADQSTGRAHRDVAEFNQKIGKKHAAFFTYCGYKSGLPDKWFENLKENGAAAQWAIEPHNLEEIQDDDYLHGMALAARDSGVPVFVRFASEMNGGWTPYHTPPALYREKFQMVAHVFHSIAPNVAMVWCPNEIPQSNIADYYPGDDAVDWVGVNFYSCYYNNGNPSRPVAWCNPADKLDYIYQRYASRHPIMICEWAATHHEKADGIDRPSFAAEKIGQLYSALPRRYPRIKAVFWLDMNAIEYADDPRTRKNDYSLLSMPQVAASYRRAVSSPYYLSHVSGDEMAPREIAPLTDHTTVSGPVTFSAYVKTYAGSPRVVWSINGRQMEIIDTPGAYDWTLNTANLPNGPARISATAFDERGRAAAAQTTTVVIDNGGSGNSGNGGASVSNIPKPQPPTKHVVAHHAATPHTVAHTPARKTVVASIPVVHHVATIPHATTPPHRAQPPAPIPTPTPAPTPLPTPAPLTLGDALTNAITSAYTLGLAVTPSTGVVFLGGRTNNGIRMTATLGSAGFSGESPTVVFLMLHGTGDNAPVDLIGPTESTDDALTELAASPGASLSIPQNPKHSLRPDTAGIYTVRAVLVPTRDAARALIQACSAPSATWNSALTNLRTTTLPAGSVVYLADKKVEVVTR